ncbi:MAG: CHASE2 domain-containing protein, partial [Leptothrix sp. (in: b-proteobacteria)]
MARPSSVLWKHSWMAALAVLAVFCSAWWLTDRFEPLERRWYDLLVASTPLAPAPDLAVVAIDDASLAALGPWPWSRDLHARLIDTLNLAGARLVLLAVPLVGAEGEQALAQLQRIAGTVTDDPELAAHPRLPGLLLQAQEVLDADAHLVTGLTHNGHVLLAISAHRPAGTPNAEPIVQWPLAALGAAALGIGHIDWQTDADGTVRTLAPTLDVSGRRIPALALLALAQLRGDKIDTLQAQPDQRELSLGSSRLPLDRHGRLRPLLGNTARANIAHHSAQDVLSGRTPARALAGKVVLIGPTAVALLPPLQLPTQASVTPIDALALATAGMLHNQLISQPVWTELLAWLLLLGVVMHLTLLAPRLAPVSALALSSLIGTALLVSSHVAFTQTQIWLPPMLPLMGLLGGHAALLLWQLARRRWANERRTNPIDSLVDSATLDDPFELPSQQPEAPPPARPAPRQAAAAADRPAPPAVAAPAATLSL